MQVNCTKSRSGVSSRGSGEGAEKDVVQEADGRPAEWQQRPSPYRHLHPKNKTKQKQKPNRGNEALNPKKLGWKVWWFLDQGTGKAGQGRSRSRMALGSCRVSHIHTLWVETGNERVLQVAWMSQELLGSRTGRRSC